MSTLRENVESFLNLSRGLKAAIAIAEELQTADRAEANIREIEQRLRVAQEREAALRDIDEKIAAGKAYLAELEPRIERARQAYREILGPDADIGE